MIEIPTQPQNLSDVATQIGVDEEFLKVVLYRDGPENLYRQFRIKKKSGGYRVISAPTGGLYTIQKALAKLLSSWYQPRSITHGYCDQRSVVSNARPHVGRPFVLNIDLRDFFPSLNFGRVRGVFMSQPFDCGEAAATVMAQICCFQNGLPVGSPASPVVSNMICLKLDGDLQRLARQHLCRVSRYSDDITISSGRKRFPEPLALIRHGKTVIGPELEAVVASNGFEINEKKSRLQSNRVRQSVTGVVVNEKLNLNRAYVRRIRAMLYSWSEDGLPGAQAKLVADYSKDRWPGAQPQFKDVLKGRIAFLAMVRGDDDPIVSKFRRQYQNLNEGRPKDEAILATPEKKLGVVRILHLSDFHFREGTKWDADKLLDPLVNFLTSSKVTATPDVIAVTGDIAFSGQAEEYELAKVWFRNLASRLGVDVSAIFPVPGNHDVERRKVLPGPRLLLEAIQSGQFSESQLEDTLKDGAERARLLSRFTNYSRFVSELTGVQSRAEPWWSETLNLGQNTVQISGFCSPLASFTEGEKGRLALGLPIANQLTKVHGDFNLALMHHPRTYFSDSDHPAVVELEKWSDLVLRGHLHSNQFEMASFESRQVAELAAGSAYQGSSYFNGVSMIEADLANASLSVEIFEWRPQTREWIKSRDHSDSPDGNIVRPIPNRS